VPHGIIHEPLILVQAQQSAACNAAHTIDARLARWLLRCRDLQGSDDLLLTQEFIAEMLGVRRTSVSVVANTLQQAGLIRYRRGHIRILDLEGLQDTACECYQTVKSQAERLLKES
jgi:DNA-binding MarR family transcriptional regulator